MNELREAINKVDSIECTAAATHRIGDRLACEKHYVPVLRAYWETNCNLVLFNVSEALQLKCGDTYTPRVDAELAS